MIIIIKLNKNGPKTKNLKIKVNILGVTLKIKVI